MMSSQVIKTNPPRPSYKPSFEFCEPFLHEMLIPPASMLISSLNDDHRTFKAVPPLLHRPRHRHISPVCRLPSCAKSGSRISKKIFLTISPGAAHLCSSYHHWLASRGSSSGFPSFQQGCHRLSGKEIWEYSDGMRRYNPGFCFSSLYQKYILYHNNCNMFYINGQMGLLKGPK